MYFLCNINNSVSIFSFSFLYKFLDIWFCLLSSVAPLYILSKKCCNLLIGIDGENKDNTFSISIWLYNNNNILIMFF